MAIFSDLANELIIGIWDYVLDPEDVESFALVSKRIYGLSSAFLLEHARLKRQFSKTHFYFAEKAAPLLEQMLHNPRIALYISELYLQQWGYRRVDRFGPDTMAVLESAIRYSSFVAPSEVFNWIREVELGNEDAILALIVMRLTKMRKLRFYKYFRGGDRYLLQTLERIMHSSDASTHLGLSIVEGEPDGRIQLVSPRPPTLSSLTELELGASRIEFDVLARLLRSIKELKSFSYITGRDSNFELPQIYNALSESSRHSLQKLRLHDHQGSREPMGDITRFQKLSVLKIDFVLLFGIGDEPLRHMADALPMSIETVTLYSCERVPCETVRKVILEMVKSKTKRLPNLKTLIFRDSPLAWSHCQVADELDEKCAKVGVLLGRSFLIGSLDVD